MTVKSITEKYKLEKYLTWDKVPQRIVNKIVIDAKKQGKSHTHAVSAVKAWFTIRKNGGVHFRKKYFALIKSVAQGGACHYFLKDYYDVIAESDANRFHKKVNQVFMESYENALQMNSVTKTKEETKSDFENFLEFETIKIGDMTINLVASGDEDIRLFE